MSRLDEIGEDSMITSLEWARAAGFFNGEGSFYLHRQRRKDGSFHVHPRISITQSGLEKPQDLIQFHEALGCPGVFYGPYRYKGGNPRWQYRISGAEKVKMVLDTLQPWLSDVKIQKAQDVIYAYITQEWRQNMNARTLTEYRANVRIVKI